MPYLKLTCPEIDTATRERVAQELTNAVVHLNASRHITADELRERCTVHFTPYSPDSMAIGGRLMRDRPESDVTLEYSDWNLSRRRRRRLAPALTRVLAGLFQMENQTDHMNIRFHPYPPSDFAVGGRLLADVVPLVGRVMKRFAG